MFPIDVWITYTLACLLLVISPRPDNILAIGRGLSQGKLAACFSGAASGMGIFASRLASWLHEKPKVINGLNIGAGLTFITSGLAVAALKQR
jgi:threonine/homoserine/homoserine lactone efflux protein